MHKLTLKVSHCPVPIMCRQWGIIQISHTPYSENIHCSWGRATNWVSQYNVLYYIQTDRKISLSLRGLKNCGQRQRLKMLSLGVVFNNRPEQQYGKTCKQKGGLTAGREGVCSFRRIPSTVWVELEVTGEETSTSAIVGPGQEELCALRSLSYLDSPERRGAFWNAILGR